MIFRRLHLIALVFALAMSGCTNHEPPSFRLNHKLVESPQTYLPHKILILDVDVVIKEMTYGGVSEEVPEWSRQGTDITHQALLKHFQNDKASKIQFMELPKLKDADIDLINQHLALYRRVAITIHDYAYSPLEWPQKITQFDYTIGPGLKSIADKTGADSAIIVIGSDRASTTGRKIAAFFSDSVSYGYSFLSAGIVNLRSGDILWYNSDYQYKGYDLRDADDNLKMMGQLFDEYPGVERYKNIRLQ